MDLDDILSLLDDINWTEVGTVNIDRTGRVRESLPDSRRAAPLEPCRAMSDASASPAAPSSISDEGMARSHGPPRLLEGVSAKSNCSMLAPRHMPFPTAAHLRTSEHVHVGIVGAGPTSACTQRVMGSPGHVSSLHVRPAHQHTRSWSGGEPLGPAASSCCRARFASRSALCALVSRACLSSASRLAFTCSS